MESLTSLATRVSIWRPDVVFVFDGYNDVSVASIPGFLPDYHHSFRYLGCRPLWVDDLPPVFWSSALALRLGVAAEKIELASRASKGDRATPWTDGEFDPRGLETFARNLEQMRRLAQGRLVVVTQAYNRPGVRGHQAIGLAAVVEKARRFAKDERLPLVDADANPPPPWPDFTDACHLVDGEARKRYAAKMLPLVRAALTEARRS